MTRPRLIAGLAIPVALAIAIVLVLVNNRDQESPPTVTAAAPTTLPPTTQPPQDHWLTIVRQIVEYRHSLFENPQPQSLKNIYDTNCACYQQDFRVLTDLRRRNLHYDDQGTIVRSVKLVGRARDPSKPVVSVEVVSQQLAQVLVDESGSIVNRTPASAPTRNVFQLIRGTDQQWRVFQAFRLPS